MSRGWRRLTSRKFGPHRTGATKSLSCTSTTTFLNTYWTLWTSNTPTHQYIVYHTKANKPSNSLLHDIAVINQYNSTKLEDWLMEIEAAEHLTNERQTKLAKAKLRGLTHTLVMETIQSGKSWEEIKDLLRLKLCNANIHTYTSYFMDIQKQEKEPLAAYITDSKLKQRDAISQMMLPPLGFL